MSAPLRLTATDLRNLALALDKLAAIHEENGVTPGAYGPGITVHTENGDDISLDVELVEGQFVIDDRYGS